MAEEKKEDTSKTVAEDKPTPEAQKPVESDSKPAAAPRKETADKPTPQPVEQAKPVTRPTTQSHADSETREALDAERLENARLNAMLKHPEITRDDLNTLCSASTPEGVSQWADRFAQRVKKTVSQETAGQAALSRAAAHQGGVATPAADKYSPANLYELASKNASPRNNN